MKLALLCAAVFFLIVSVRGESVQDNLKQESGTHFRTALELEHKGDLENAIKEYREAVKETPQHADSHYNLARLLAARGDYDGAIVEYREALSSIVTTPTFTTIWALL